jgi:hypothetical protein
LEHTPKKIWTTNKRHEKNIHKKKGYFLKDENQDKKIPSQRIAGGNNFQKRSVVRRQ